MYNDGGEKNKVKKALSQFVEAKGNMTIILDSLEEAFNEITLLVKLGIEVMLYLEINFIGNTNCCPVRDEVRTNFVVTVRTVCKYFLSCKLTKSRIYFKQGSIAVGNQLQ